MKIVFHDQYKEVYTSDPAARKGRLDKAEEDLRPLYEFVEPDMALEDEILLVHTLPHYEQISRSSKLFEVALLAAGGAIKASELAMQGEPAFGLIRPPGHHASPDDCWGFCWFNNMAIAIERLRNAGRIKKAYILDFDLHFGDGTKNFFEDKPDVTYFHMNSVRELPSELAKVKECDIIGISAGFDRHIEDWGGMLSTDDYRVIGSEVKAMADRLCPNKIFAVLEGGYNHDILGENIKALCEGLEG